MGRRVFAVLIDWFVIVVLASFFFYVAVVSLYDKVPTPEGSDSVASACDGYDSNACYTFGQAVYASARGSVTFAPFAVAVGFVVLVLFQGLTGATVGKFLVGLRVVDRNGRPPGVPRTLLRTVFLLIDAFPWVIPFLGWLIALTNARHRRLGDLAAGTMVVRRRALAYIRR